MSDQTHDAEKRHDCTDLEKRDLRALTEKMTVLPAGGDVFDVVSQSGNSYRVDRREGRCTCPDYQHREPDGGCKHVRRVRYATGVTAVPAVLSRELVDSQLGAQTDATPVVAATDGGVAVDTVDTDVPDDRPDDCGCWDPEQALPCWPCWRDGFETPNPAVDG